MTAHEFRRIALSLPQASEAAHMGHPDFRVGGRIFATLGYPRSGWGMVKLTPEQQELFVRTEPAVFAPVKGGMGSRWRDECAVARREEGRGSRSVDHRLA